MPDNNIWHGNGKNGVSEQNEDSYGLISGMAESVARLSGFRVVRAAMRYGAAKSVEFIGTRLLVPVAKTKAKQ